MSRITVLKSTLLGATFALSLFSNAQAAGYLEDIELKNGGLALIEAQDIETTLSGNYLAAQTAYNDNNAKVAVEFYEKAIVQDPENAILKQAMFAALTSNGQIDKAILLLNEIGPEDQTEILNFAVSAADALKKKSWARALTQIENIEGTDLENMTSKLFGAWALVGDRKIDEAIAKAETVTGPDWTKVIKNFHVGLILSASDRDKEAIPFFEQAISNRSVASALTETYIRAIEALGRAHARSGDVKKAKLVIRDGLALLPTNPTLAQVLASLEKEEAITALVSSPQQGASEIFFNIGAAISRQGGLPFAQSHLQLAHFLDPKSDVALLSLANVYETQSSYERANEYYSKIAADGPYARRSQLEIGMNLNQMDKVDESIESLSALVTQDPDDLSIVSALSRIYSQHEKYLPAAKLLNDAIPRIALVNRNHWSLFYRRGIAFERTNQWDKAEADFRKALELSPNQADVLNYLGYSWIDKGTNLKEGLKMIHKAVELRPNSGFIIDSLGWAFYRLERYEEAVVELETAIKYMPTDPVLNDHLGDAYWKVDRKLEATFQWKHALNNEPSDENQIIIEKKLQEGLTH